MSKPKIFMLGIGLIVIALIAGIYWSQQQEPTTGQPLLPDRPSIEISSAGETRPPVTRVIPETPIPRIIPRTPILDGPRLQGTIGGIVRDEQQQPIAGAQVTLLQPPSAANRLLAPLPEQVFSDEQGRFSLADIAFRGSVALCLHAEAPGYARQVSPLHTFDDSHTSVTIELMLSAGLTLKVKVVDAEQQPLPGALVRLSNPPAKEWHGAALESEEICEVDGISIFSNQPPGTLEIYAQAEGFVPQQTTFILNPEFAANDEPLIFELEEGRLLAGRTIDEQETPLEGVRITVQDLGANNNPRQAIAWEAISDLDGYWEIDQLRSVDYLLTATHSPGYNQQMIYRRHFPAIRPPRENLEIVFSLGGAIQAQAVDENSDPVSNVLVSLELLNPARAGGARAATRIEPTSRHFTNETGEIAINALPTGVYRLRLDAPGHRQVTKNGIRVTSPEATDLGLVTMSEGLGIMGRIVSLDDLETLPDAVVILRGAGFIKRKDADSQGNFQFLDLLPGNFSLTCTHPNYLEKQIDDFYYTGDELVNLGDLYLDKGGIIRGTVTNQQGRLLPEVSVRIDAVEQFAGTGEGMAPKQVITNAAGRFSLIGLEPSLYLVSCTLRIVEPTGNKGNFTYQQVDLTERPEAEINLVLEQSANLFVTFATEDGSPLISSTVAGYSLLPFAAENYMAFNRHPGQTNELSLNDLSPGEYLILVSGDTARQTLRQGEQVTLTEGDNRLDFSFGNHERSGLVSSASTGEPLSNCTVGFRLLIPGYEPDLNQSWLLTSSVQTNAEGRFTIRGLQNQSYLISVRPQGSTRKTDIDIINIAQTASGDVIEIRAPDGRSKH